MKLYVPQPGEAAVLLRPWSFTLHPERRNTEFHHSVFPDDPTWGEWEGCPSYTRKGSPVQVTLPVYTELVFDRVYVRQGAEDYASLTLVIKRCSLENVVGERFWVKLDDANMMEFERTTSGNPIGAFARGAYRKMLQESRDPELAKKNAQKKAGTDAAKAALAAARGHVENLVAASQTGPVNMHVENLVTEAVRELKALHPKLISGSWCTREGVLYDMSHPPTRKNDPQKWACTTSRAADGDVTRELRYVVDPFSRSPKRLGGFRLTMRGAEVLSCEPLT